ncbi:MAG: 1-acyl-sn-glycerol-3-phosphate acyltransferase, partial [Clostridia bacterium]|nr:1-acyl-sn-glycerol-3-phosphate acyltransferase [Deltaproteobacteria bacterium]
LFATMYSSVVYPPEAAERVRTLSQTGSIVYVARAPTTWIALFFNWVFDKLGLPLPEFVGGYNMRFFQPFERIWRARKNKNLKPTGAWADRFNGQPPKPDEVVFGELASVGAPAFIFMRQPRGVANPGGMIPDGPDGNNYFRTLVAVQRGREASIHLIPQAVVDKNQAGSATRSITDRIFGDRRRPGSLRLLAMQLVPWQQTVIRVADPIDLKAFIAETRDQDDEIIAKRLRHELQKRISEEERVIAGPDLAEHGLIHRHVLRSPEVKAAIEAVAKIAGKSIAELEKKAKRDLDHIAAKYNVRYVGFAGRVLGWVFNRIYDGVVIDEPGLAAMLEASRKGPIIMCPTHRSHIDYLVLSYALWRYGVNPPHIVAGANLSFFPLGSFFRRTGAFFMRRSFKDDKLYAAVFQRYVVELVRTGTSIEFFPEGTRSRTGKMLMPRFGILKMTVDAFRERATNDLIFVPISLDYERIIEASAYERELMGDEKKAEDVRGLLKTTKVLRSRYGRVHIQFGEPMSLAELVRERQLPMTMDPSGDELWRIEIERLGYRILHSAAMVASVTPPSVVATVLLGHQGRGMARSVFLERASGLLDFLETGGGRLSESLTGADERVVDRDGRNAAILESVQNLVEDGLVAIDRAGRGDAEPIYRVPEDRRIALDFYKNGVMNQCAPAALVARAIVKSGNNHPRYDELHDSTRRLSRLFKREFLYRADSGFTTYFDDALASLAVRGMLDVHDDGSVVVHTMGSIKLLSGLLDSYVEAYWVTSRTLQDLREFPLWDKELQSRSLERARRAYFEGEISRPEAANRTLIETALTYFVATRVITLAPDGKRKTATLTPGYEGEKLDALIAEIRAYL